MRRAAVAMNPGLVEQDSPFGFAATLDRLSAAITTAGLTIFAQIDHAAGAKDVGLVMPRTTVLIYGNARGGTPVMLASPAAALDLPLRVLVREEPGGRTLVVFHPVVPALRAFGVPEALAARLEPAQQVLLNALLAAYADEP